MAEHSDPVDPVDTEMGTTLRDAPVVGLEELLRSVPRLVERTMHQAELVRTVAGSLPCLGSLLLRRSVVNAPGAVTPEQLAVLDLFADDDSSVEAAVTDTPPTRTPAEAAAVPVQVRVPDESELAVPDYDSLAASQVVPRLAMLSTDDLRAVHTYEQAHRHRQTILNRVTQLLEA